MKQAQEQPLPRVELPQKTIHTSLQGLPSLTACAPHDDDGGEELSPPNMLKKFNQVLNELLKDEDTPEKKDNSSSGHVSMPPLDASKKYNPFSTDSLLNSKKTRVDSSPEKSSEEHSRPDYSLDFNSESDMIGRDESVR